jgi:hypothetical protein
MCSLFTRS